MDVYASNIFSNLPDWVPRVKGTGPRFCRFPIKLPQSFVQLAPQYPQILSYPWVRKPILRVIVSVSDNIWKLKVKVLFSSETLVSVIVNIDKVRKKIKK
jgi:hypothetical protein